MTIQLGQIAPDFEQDTTHGRIRFHDWLGGTWAMLFSHPGDFTPVCATELGVIARLGPEWARRGVKVIGLSLDRSGHQAAWEADVVETQGVGIGFAMILDHDGSVARLYGMVPPGTETSALPRSLFLIGPDHRVRLSMSYPLSAGRNFDEVLRVIDSLQLTEAHKVLTPGNWVQGERVIITPSVSDEDAAARFPKGWVTLKPYLRMVEQPDATGER